MSGRGIVSCVLLFLSVWLTGPSYAGQQTLAEERVVVRFDEQLLNAAKEVIRVFPGIRAELERDLGWATAFRPEVILIKDSVSFRKAAENDLVTAFAIPQKNLVVIDYARMHVHPFTLGTTLKHELCHLELHHHISDGKLPRWLDEGICQWVTGGGAEIMTDGSRSVLREATLSGRIIGIRGLAERFPAGGRDLLLAYEESRSIIEYIEKEYGASGIRGIVKHMAEGDHPEDAVRKGLMISLDELEERWRSSLVEKTSWFSYIGDNIYEVLFLFAALMTLYGFVKMLNRKRAYKDQDEEPWEEDDG
jgi:hypothetical protein